MTTKTKTGYPYSALSKKAKERAREEWREAERNDPSYELSELLGRDLEDHFGLTNCKLFYSLGYCQGDGVAFDGHPDVDEWAKHDETLAGMLKEIHGLAALTGYEVDLRVHIEQRDNHYYHWNTMRVSVDHDEEPCPYETPPALQAIYDKIEALEEYLAQRVKDISRELEKTGYAEIEYYDSDEYIDELLTENDHYMFSRRGEWL